jgi:hypothetical protein
MEQSRSGKPAQSVALRIATAAGRALVTAVKVFGATLNAASGGGNALLLPPDPPPAKKRGDYRP